MAPPRTKWKQRGPAVCAAPRSERLTQGPLVAEFEQAIARRVGAPHVTAVSNGTAALHVAYAALGLGERGDGTDPALGQRAAERLRRRVAARLAHGALIDPGEVGARLVEDLAQDRLELVAAGAGGGCGPIFHRGERTPTSGKERGRGRGYSSRLTAIDAWSRFDR